MGRMLLLSLRSKNRWIHGETELHCSIVVAFHCRPRHRGHAGWWACRLSEYESQDMPSAQLASAAPLRFIRFQVNYELSSPFFIVWWSIADKLKIQSKSLEEKELSRLPIRCIYKTALRCIYMHAWYMVHGTWYVPTYVATCICSDVYRLRSSV